MAIPHLSEPVDGQVSMVIDVAAPLFTSVGDTVHPWHVGRRSPRTSGENRIAGDDARVRVQKLNNKLGSRCSPKARGEQVCTGEGWFVARLWV